MRRICFISICLLLLSVFSCKEEHLGFDIDFHDPQNIPELSDRIPNDLLEAFGESYIHFGPNPPNLNDLSFKVDTLRYDTCIRYVYVPAFDSVMLSPSAPPIVENALYQHHFYNQIGNIIQHKLNIHDRNYGNEYTQKSDTVFIIGSGNSFTAYFQVKIKSEKDGNPTWGFLVSGTVVSDSTGFKGVTGYRIGKKIIEVETAPTAGYYAGTIMIMEPFNKDHMALYWEWDTDPDPKAYPF